MLSLDDQLDEVILENLVPRPHADDSLVLLPQLLDSHPLEPLALCLVGRTHDQVLWSGSLVSSETVRSNLSELLSRGNCVAPLL